MWSGWNSWKIWGNKEKWPAIYSSKQWGGYFSFVWLTTSGKLISKHYSIQNHWTCLKTGPSLLPEPAAGKYHLQGMIISTRFSTVVTFTRRWALLPCGISGQYLLALQISLYRAHLLLVQGHATLVITTGAELTPCRSCWGWCDSIASIICWWTCVDAASESKTLSEWERETDRLKRMMFKSPNLATFSLFTLWCYNGRQHFKAINTY